MRAACAVSETPSCCLHVGGGSPVCLRDRDIFLPPVQAGNSSSSQGFQQFMALLQQQQLSDQQSGQQPNDSTLLSQVIGQAQQSGAMSTGDVQTLQAVVGTDVTPQNLDPTLMQDAQQAQGQMSSAGYGQFMQVLQQDVAQNQQSGQPVNDASLLWQATGQMEQQGASSSDTNVAQSLAENATSSLNLDSTLQQVSQDAQSSGMSTQGYAQFMQYLSQDAGNATGLQVSDSNLLSLAEQQCQQGGMSTGDQTDVQNVVQSATQSSTPWWAKPFFGL